MVVALISTAQKPHGNLSGLVDFHRTMARMKRNVVFQLFQRGRELNFSLESGGFIPCEVSAEHSLRWSCSPSGFTLALWFLSCSHCFALPLIQPTAFLSTGQPCYLREEIWHRDPVTFHTPQGDPVQLQHIYSQRMHPVDWASSDHHWHQHLVKEEKCSLISVLSVSFRCVLNLPARSGDPQSQWPDATLACPGRSWQTEAEHKWPRKVGW